MSFVPLSTIRGLREELRGTGAEILTWGCDGYSESVKQWNAIRDTHIGAVVRVASIQEAATVIRFVTSHGIPLAIKGGGCSTSGASTTHGGIVLDLFRLREVHVDPDRRVLVAQGGATWEDIDHIASQYHLAVVGSTVNRIGAAGSTLGGGYGWLTGQYGLAIDNVLWAKMILADGRLVIASEEHHPDLFWAIRGAGQCFGAAVELGFRTHKQDQPVFAGRLLFAAENLPAIVAFANQFEALTDGKQGLWFGFTMPPTTTDCVISVVVFYNGPQSAARQFFSPLFALESVMDDTQMHPYDNLGSLLTTVDIPTARDIPVVECTHPATTSVGPRKRLQGSNITLPLDISFVESIYDEFNNILRDYPTARDSRLLFELIPNARVNEIANSATAFASRGPYYNVSSLFKWTEAHLDHKIGSLQEHLMNTIGTEAGIARRPDYSITKHGTGLYANYADHHQPLPAIFGENVNRLRDLKRKYDPWNTFRKWHNIPPSARNGG